MGGAMGAIAPTAKNLWGRCTQFAPREFCYVIFETVKCTFKIRIYHYASDKSYANFSLKMHQKRLAARDPLGELTALPQTSLDLRAGAGTREGGKGKRQEGTDS